MADTCGNFAWISDIPCSGSLYSGTVYGGNHALCTCAVECCVLRKKGGMISRW